MQQDVLESQRVAWKRRREQNALRGGMFSFDAVPWLPEMSPEDAVWDVGWTFAFGDISSEMARRVDHPVDGYAWRGRRMEVALEQAARDCLPHCFRVVDQPEPHSYPIDHADRCRHDGTTATGWKRADKEFQFVSGRDITFDVRTVNLRNGTAVRGGAIPKQLVRLENEKRRRYNGYYQHFFPLVISLTGALSSSSYEGLRVLAREAGERVNARRPVPRWEADLWAVPMHRRLAMAMVRAMSRVVTCNARRSMRVCDWAAPPLSLGGGLAVTA
jgi:hypothetical protein